jgi:hypothetical protein
MAEEEASDDDTPTSPLPPFTLEEVFDLKRLQDDKVVAALDLWKQGDVISGLRLVWTASKIHDILFDELPESDDASLGDLSNKKAGQSLGHFLYDPDEVEEGEDQSPAPPPARYDYGIITSQTCDIAATGPGARHPTVQVSPLIWLDSLGERADMVRRGATVDMIVVPNVRPAGEWAADLRISIPVSKGVLLDRGRRRGFKNAESELAFAEAIALKYWRPALHDAVEGLLVRSLDSFIRGERVRGVQWVDSVEQFRIMVNRGTRLQPSEVTILVLTIGEGLAPHERDPLRKWRVNNRKGFSNACDGADLCPIRFERVEQISLADYRNSVPLRITELQRSTNFTLG